MFKIILCKINNMWVHFLSFAAISGSLMLAILLFIKKTPLKTANRLLAIIFICFGYITFVMWIWNHKLYERFIFFIGTDFIILTLLGTLFYHFIISMLGEKINWNYKKLIHILPAILPLSYYVYFQSFPYNEKINYCVNAYNKYPEVCIFMNIFYTVLWIFYLCLSYKKILDYQKMLKDNFSNIEIINLSWLKNLIIVFMFVFLTICIILNVFSNEVLNEIVVIHTMVFFYVFLFYKTINHPFILNNQGYEKKVVGYMFQ